MADKLESQCARRTGHVIIEALQLELPARDLVVDHGQVVQLRRCRACRDGPLQVLELRLAHKNRVRLSCLTKRATINSCHLSSLSHHVYYLS